MADRRSTTHFHHKTDCVTQLTVKDPSNVRMLQLTDIHFFTPTPRRNADQQTHDDMKRLVDLTEPDLLLVTGDLWYENVAGRGEEQMHYAVDTMAALGRPWLFTWGNHDMLNNFNEGHDALTYAENSLYCGKPENGNYVVQLTDKHGKAIWDLFCLNSHVDGLGRFERSWLRAMIAARHIKPGAPNAFALFHVPLKQYEKIWRTGIAGGICLERIGFRVESGATLDHLRALRTVRACFCGHDHINDFAGRTDDIDLVYGRATGYAGYGANQVPKGAKLVTVNAEAGSYAWESVLPDGARWKETAGVQLKQPKDAPWAREANA